MCHWPLSCSCTVADPSCVHKSVEWSYTPASALAFNQYSCSRHAHTVALQSLVDAVPVGPQAEHIPVASRCLVLHRVQPHVACGLLALLADPPLAHVALLCRQVARRDRIVDADCTLMSPVRSALERIQPRVVSFEEQVTVIREALAALHEREEEYTRAAQILAGIDLDSGASLGKPRGSGLRSGMCQPSGSPDRSG